MDFLIVVRRGGTFEVTKVAIAANEPDQAGALQNAIAAALAGGVLFQIIKV